MMSRRPLRAGLVTAWVLLLTLIVMPAFGSPAKPIDPQVDKLSGTAPLTVQFTANDTGNTVRLRRWQFGDGSESRTADPAHTYISQGDFTATYTAYHRDGSSTTRAWTITVTDPTAPVIQLSSPTTESYTTSDSTVELVGEARSDMAQIVSVVWDNVHTGEARRLEIESGPAVNWNATVELKPGLNEILMTTTDAKGRVATRRLWVTRQIAGPAISAIAVNTTSPRVYEKYEVTFAVETVADHPLFVYDPAPPPGAEQYNGVTVEGLVTLPSGETVTHPAFYFAETSFDRQRYRLTGQAQWKLRIAPLVAGVHQVALRVTDQSGTQTVEVGQFDAQPPERPGFIQVAPADPRYFAYTNGDLYWPLGMTWAGSSGVSPDGIDLAHTVLNYDRVWMGGSGAYSTNWSRWINGAEDFGNEGFLPHLSFTEHYPGSELAQHLHYPEGFRFWLSCWLDSDFCPDIQAGTRYQVKLRVKTLGITGPRQPGLPYGLVIKNHDWLGLDPPAAVDAALQNQPSWITPVAQTTDWHTIVTTFVARSGADDFSIYLENVTSGTAFIDEFSVRAVRPDGRLGPEIIRNPRADMHTYVEQRPLAAFDDQVAAGERNGIHLRYVVQDKNDWIPNHLDASSGVFVEAGDGYYQPENSKATWLQKQWWRYLAARFGYSPSVFAWELNNEGPPDNGTGTHARHAQLFGRWLHTIDLHPHLASTSFWCCWEPRFWGDHVNFPDVDFADIHHYGAPTDMVQWYLTDALPAINSQIGKPVLRAETGVFASENSDGLLDLFTRPNPGIWFHNLLWSQLHYASMFDVGYWFPEHVVGFSREAHARPFFNFVRGLDVHTGGYDDLRATSGSPLLRIFGQKNQASNQAYGWVNHRDHTWKQVMEQGVPPPVNARITFQMNPHIAYTVSWYDTYTGAITATEVVNADAAGMITLQIENFSRDVAFKLSGA
jgi:PKD repeat protein